MHETSTVWNELARRILTVQQIRDVDRVAIEQYGMSSLVLMENAALGCVHWLREKFPTPSSAVVLCGRGNNGGDGLAIARHLRVHGWLCSVAVLGPIERMSHDAQANLRILRSGGDCELLFWESDTNEDSMNQLEQRIANAEVIIDAMLGTGATGEPKAPLSHWIQLANASRATRIAIDIPTGWDASTSERSTNTFTASATLTFVARKPAMAEPTAANLLGELAVIPIGIPALQIAKLLRTLDSQPAPS